MSAQPINREQWMAYCATLAQTYERAMNTETLRETLSDLLLDYGAAAIELFELEGVPWHYDQDERLLIAKKQRKAKHKMRRIREHILDVACGADITKA